MKRHLLVIVTVLALAACGNKDAAPSEPDLPAGSAAAAPPAASASKTAFEARRVFQTLCATCHGSEGKGNGPASSGLDPKPRDYTDKAWQATVTDDQLRQIITLGGQAVGKSAVMPGSPQLKGQPEVVDELVKIIRAFGK
jgi:cytochrome c553